jgi:RNA polymerase sigma factor (sigma-70 family)
MSNFFSKILSPLNKFLSTFVEYCSHYTLNKHPVTPTNVHSDNTIIAEILEGRETTLRRIYPLYAAEFKAWAGRYVQCSQADLTDAYQEALVAFYRNIVSGRLTNLTSSLKTYIFAIGYRQLKKAMRAQHNISFMAEPSETELPQDPHFLQLLIEEEDYQAQKSALGQALEQLSPSCQKVLELYFYEGYSIPQIKEQLNYQSENSVSVQKSRCLKSLKEILENY